MATWEKRSAKVTLAKSLKTHWFLIVFEVSASMEVIKKVKKNICEGGFVDASVQASMLATILYQKRSEIGPKIVQKSIPKCVQKGYRKG